MKLFVGVTDNGWFKFLAERRPDELNFWLPAGNQAFRALNVGDSFLFKLHSPLNFIVGGGFFVSYSALPLSIAWQSFAEKNGSPDFVSFRRQILKYRERTGIPEPDPTIGCIILANPFFLPERDWIPIPSDWKTNIVRGKTYDTSELIGADLWDSVKYALHAGQAITTANEQPILVAEEAGRYGAEYLTRSRLGQGAFRVLVTDAYSRRCAITNEKTLPVLQAAHIKPFMEFGPNRVDNGLLLRSDLHILFDQGFLTVTEDLHVEVSSRIKEEYQNGRDYYALHGKQLQVLPSRDADLPSREFLAWHNSNVYSG
jgi:putative restriction endonuclease